MAPNRTYVASDVPLKGQSEVIVTNAAYGPSKFSIRLKNSNWEYQRMRSELESTALHSLQAIPDKGTPCIAVKSEKLHRGLVLSTNRDKNTSNVCLVDFGTNEALPHNMLFQIPSEIMAYRLFCSTVALTDGEALSQKPGLNEIFASLVPRLDHLMCEVVNVEAPHQTVNLYDVKGQNIAEVVLRMYDSLVPKLKALSPPAPPTIPKIEIPEPQLQSTEKLFVMVSHKVGHFFGQLLTRPTSELTDIFSELHSYYEANPEAPRLDVESCIGEIAVVKWAEDGQYYRCRILNVSGNCVEIQFVDFGDVITVPRRDVLAPFVSSCFSQPAFGINCLLSRDGAAVLKKEDWDEVLLEKSIEVRIVNKYPDGTYTVSFTIDPYNHMVLEGLYPQNNPITRQPVPQVEPIRPPIQPPSMVSQGSQVEPKRLPYQAPSRASEATPAETRPLNKPGEDLIAKKPPTRQIYVHPNIRTSVPVQDPFAQRLATSSVVQEIVRTPRGPPSDASGSQRGFARAEPTATKTTDATQMDRGASSIPTIPVPTGTYAFLDTAHQSVGVAWFYSFERFFLTPVDVTNYEVELEPLNAFYAALSPNELVEDSPKVGLPCVVQFKDDCMFYRSQIVAILSDKTAQILFVDYGNEQITPLKDIKRIVPKFMKLPQLVWPCKLAGIDGSQLRSDVTLTVDDELVATFLSVDKGVHLVKVLHKTHGDMTTYVTKKSIPVPRPAASQLRDPKHPLRPDGYDIYVSFVKSASEFWIQLKVDEQIVNDVGEELAQHVEKGAVRVEHPVVGQLYAMELPEVGGYYRARVCSVDGKMVQATFVDYGDAHPVSCEKVFTLPDRLEALPPLATRCSMSRQKWPLEAEKRFVMMTYDPATVFRAVFQSSSGEGIRVVDSLSLDGRNIEEKIFAGLDAVPMNEQRKVETAAPAAPLPQKIEVPEPSPAVKHVFPRPAVCDLCDPSIQMDTKEHDVYISYSKSHTEFYIQLKADEEIINKVPEVVAQHMETAPQRVTRPVVGQIYVMEHPTLGGHFRARVSSITGNTVQACFVDYGDMLAVPIEKIYVAPAGLESLPPLAACCRMQSLDWSQEVQERFVSITSDVETVFRVSLGPMVGQSVREVETLFLHGQSIEEKIFPQVDKQKSEVTESASQPATEVTEPVVELEVAFIHPAITDFRDPVGHDVFVSFVNSPSEFYIQLKADEGIINQLLVDLSEPLERASRPVVVDQLYAVEHPMIGGKFRGRIISVSGTDAQVFFVDYGDEYPVPMESIFVLPEHLRLLPPLATRCRMERQEWLPGEKKSFVSITSDLDHVYRATFGDLDDYGVRRVYSLFLGGKNIEDDIFPEPENKENVGPARIESEQPVPLPVTALPAIPETVEPIQSNDLAESGSLREEKKVLPRSAISDLYSSGTRQLDGYQVYISCVNSPSDFHVQMKADEDLIYAISAELEQHVKNGAAVVERPVVDQLYVMEHPILGSFYRVRITPMVDGAVEACFVEYGETHSVQTPKIYQLPTHLKWLPFLAARCSMKRENWTPEAKDRFVVIASDNAAVFRAVFDAVEENGTCRINALFLDGKNIEDDIFIGLAEDTLTQDAIQEPVIEKADPILVSVPENVEPEVEEATQSLQTDPELLTGLEDVVPEVEEAAQSLQTDAELPSYQEAVEPLVEGATQSKQKTEPVKEEMIDTNLSLGKEEEEVDPLPAPPGPFEDPNPITEKEVGTEADPETAMRPESTLQPDMVEAVECLKDEVVATGKSCAQEPSLEEMKPVESIPIGNLIAIDDYRPSLPEIKAAPLIDLITAPLEAVPLDPILVPVVQVLKEGSSESAVIESTVGENQTVPIFVDDEPSILTAETAPIGPVVEEQKAVSLSDEPSIRIAMKLDISVENEQQDVMIRTSDEPPVQVGVKVTISAEEEKRAASVPMKEKGEEDTHNTVEPAAVKVVETNQEKPVSPVLIETDVASDPFAASDSIVPDEEEPASMLKEEAVSDPAVTDLIPLETDDGHKVSIPPQLVQEVATGAEEDLVDTHTESANVPDIEVERPTVCFEPFENSKQEIVKDDTTSNIIEPANLDGVEEESLRDREEVADLIEELPASVHFVGAGTSDVKGGAVSDPVITPPLLLTPLHFAAPATEVEQAGSASPVTEKQFKMELIVKEERTITIESHFELDSKMLDESFSSSFPTPDRSVLDDSSTLDLLGVSMVCNNGDEKTGDEQLASLPEFMDDSLINELLNGPIDSQSGWKTVEEINLAKKEQSHSGIPENAVFMGSGGVVDEQPPFIPDESDLMFTVEAEMVGEPLEEA